MAHYAFLNDNNIVTEVITGMMRMLQRDYQKVLLIGKPGTQTSEDKLVKELLTTQWLTHIVEKELLLEVTMLV